jgi:hypothetical protein
MQSLEKKKKDKNNDGLSKISSEYDKYPNLSISSDHMDEVKNMQVGKEHHMHIVVKPTMKRVGEDGVHTIDAKVVRGEMMEDKNDKGSDESTENAMVDKMYPPKKKK